MVNRASRRGFVLPEPFILKIIEEMASGLTYLHTGVDLSGRLDPHSSRIDRSRPWNAIVHRDIKLDNIFLTTITRSVYPRVVLGDFGHAASQRLHEELGHILPRFHGQSVGPQRGAIYGFHTDTRMLGQTILEIGLRSDSNVRQPGLSEALLDLVQVMYQGDRRGQHLSASQIVENSRHLQAQAARHNGLPQALPEYLLPSWSERQPRRRHRGDDTNGGDRARVTNQQDAMVPGYEDDYSPQEIRPRERSDSGIAQGLRRSESHRQRSRDRETHHRRSQLPPSRHRSHTLHQPPNFPLPPDHLPRRPRPPTPLNGPRAVLPPAQLPHYRVTPGVIDHARHPELGRESDAMRTLDSAMRRATIGGPPPRLGGHRSSGNNQVEDYDSWYRAQRDYRR